MARPEPIRDHRRARLSAAAGLLLLPVFLAGCAGSPEGDREFETVVITGEEPPAGSGTLAELEPAAATPEDTPAEPVAPPPGPGAQQEAPPNQAAIDSLTAQLRAIAAAQQVILSRLDSMQPGAAGGPVQADAAGSDALNLEGATEEVRSLGVNIFWALVVIVVFHFLIRALAWFLETMAEQSVRRRLTIKWLIPITRMALWGIAAYLILRTVFRVDTQGLLAASAALGLALGIAAQDLLKNIFGGLIVVFDQPFQVGDKISVGGTYGEVVSIGLRSTRIVTPDDNLVSVPNSQVVEEQVANANAGELNCQVVTDLYLPGRVDERVARKIAFDAAVNSQYVFLNKPIVVLVGDEFRTTFVTRVRVKAYVLDPRFEFLMQSDITERARDGFRAAGLMPEYDWYPMVRASGDGDPGERTLR